PLRPRQRADRAQLTVSPESRTMRRDGAAVPAAAPAGRDAALTAARATAGAIVVLALAFGLWRVRSMDVLLLLALTFAARIRPGVESFGRLRGPQALAIAFFFVAVLGSFGLFFWLAVPPALHQITQALSQPGGAVATHGHGIRDDVLVWLQRQLHHLPSG